VIYGLDSFIEQYIKEDVKGISTSDKAHGVYNQLALDLDPGANDVYFAFQADDEINLIRYRGTNSFEVLTQFKLANAIISLDRQISVNSEAKEPKIYFINSNYTGDEIVEYTIGKNRKVLYSTQRIISSLNFYKDKLYFVTIDAAAPLEAEIELPVVTLFQLDPVTGTSTNLAQFRSDKQYFIQFVDEQGVLLREPGLGQCYFYLELTQELLSENCLIRPLSQVEEKFVIIREVLKDADDQDTNLPESYPDEQDYDYKESIYLRKEYDNFIKANKAIEVPKLIFVGETNQDLALLYEDVDENYLYVSLLDEKTKKSLVVQIQENDLSAKTFAVPQSEYDYLGANQSRRELYFDLYKQFDSGIKESRLYSYVLKSNEFQSYILPYCPLNTSMCKVTYLQ
jgi:hypothetical protein